MSLAILQNPVLKALQTIRNNKDLSNYQLFYFLCMGIYFTFNVSFISMLWVILSSLVFAIHVFEIACNFNSTS